MWILMILGCVKGGPVEGLSTPLNRAARDVASAALWCPREHIGMRVDVVSDTSGEPIAVRVAGCNRATTLIRISGSKTWSVMKVENVNPFADEPVAGLEKPHARRVGHRTRMLDSARDRSRDVLRGAVSR